MPSVDLGALLQAVEDAPPVAAADVVGRQLAEAIGADAVSLLIADLSGHSLVRLSRRGPGEATDSRSQGSETAERLPLQDTPHGRALAEQRVQADGRCVYAPVTNRGEAIGVLEVELPEPPDEAVLAEVARVAHAFAYIVIANARFTDLYEWGQRSTPLSLAAEIQRRLLPQSYTCEAGPATIAGWLQPAEDAAGDTFDFSLARDTLHLSLTDAMGHNVNAALLATTVVAALRNARRADTGLAEQAHAAAAALADCLPGTAFATGQLVRVDLRSGAAKVVNAGHPPPLRLRDGRVTPVALEADPPLGALAGHHYREQDFPLQPGDRLFFLTDGVLERHEGFDPAALIAATADQHPRDAVQALMHAVVQVAEGVLRDDATALCVDWHGHGRKRATSGGADR